MIAKASRRYKNLQETTCEYCGTAFLAAPIYLQRGQYRFCSRECRYAAAKGQKRLLSAVGRANIIATNRRTKTGSTLSREQKQKISVAVRAIAAAVHNEEWRRKVSAATKGKHQPPHAVETRRRMSLARRGAANNNWHGGISAVNALIRSSQAYAAWRTAVFERDNYTCQGCGQRGGALEADHIKPFALYPELRLEVSNGRTLCKPCHKLLGWNLFQVNNPRKSTLIKEAA